MISTLSRPVNKRIRPSSCVSHDKNVQQMIPKKNGGKRQDHTRSPLSVVDFNEPLKIDDLVYEVDFELGVDRIKTMFTLEESAPYKTSPSVFGALRKQVLNWFFQVVDYVELDRAVVAVAVHFLDRISSAFGRVISQTVVVAYNVAAVSALGLASELWSTAYTRRALNPTYLSLMLRHHPNARLRLSPEKIAKNQNQMVQHLAWRVHPSISFDYIAHFLALLPILPGSESPRWVLQSRTHYMCENALFHPHYHPSPGKFALSAILYLLHASNKGNDSVHGMWYECLWYHVTTKVAMRELINGLEEQLARIQEWMQSTVWDVEWEVAKQREVVKMAENEEKACLNRSKVQQLQFKPTRGNTNRM